MNILIVLLCSAEIWAQQGGAPSDSQPKIKASAGVAINDATYTSVDGVFKFDVSVIGGKNITLNQRVDRKDITSSMIAESDNGNVVAIVATKIRADYPKDDTLLDKQKPRIAGGKQMFGEDFDLEDLKENDRRFLQSTLVNEKCDPVVFPIGTSQQPDVKGEQSLGVHRFFVRSGYFFEIAIVAKNTTAQKHDDLKRRVEEIMKGVARAVTIRDAK